ncbi:MAG: FAD-dependent oxidoreductase [Pseudomonadota bacterium]
MSDDPITIVGAGVLGLWQSLLLARAGHRVQLVERDATPFQSAASQYAGAMIAPDCEAEGAPAIVKSLGHEGAALWHEHYPGLVQNGTLVVAPPRDQSELRRFQRETSGHVLVDRHGLAHLEPDLADRFTAGLYFPDEAHMTTPQALSDLLKMAKSAGVDVRFGQDFETFRANRERSEQHGTSGWVVDCRGVAARAADTSPQLSGLRGVRGERLVLRAPGVTLNRTVRLLHPRHPLYVVPWSDDRFLVGATVIESDDASAVTVRSALELLGLVYALHPSFGEAEILEMTAGVRPSFHDNVPAIRVDPHARYIHVNGAYRHGFLLAPVLARSVLRFLAGADPSKLALLSVAADA